MSICRAILVAGLLMAAPAVSAATLSSLVGGGSLTAQDMTFSGFTYEDVGGAFGDHAVPSDEIFVTASAPTATSVRLSFEFDPAISLGSEEVVEIVGTFDAAVSALSSRSVVSTSLELASFFLNSPDPAFIEVGQTEQPGGVALNSVSITTNTFVVFDSTGLGNLTAFTHGWDVQMETGWAGSGSLGGFQIDYELDGVIQPPNAVPLPAGLPLLLSALFGVGLVARRRRT